MLGRLLRRFGFLFIGSLTVIGGGVMIIYGMLLVYVSAPNPRSPADLAFIHRAGAWLLGQELLYLMFVIALAGFVWEIKQVGFFPRDDRLLYEIHRDKRRELAEKKEVWDRPDMDEDSDPYDELFEDLKEEETVNLTLAQTRFNQSGTPSVSGRVLNKSSRKTFRDVVVKISFYSEEKTEIDSTIATKRELQAGDSWKFEVFPAPDASGEVHYYRVTDMQAKEV